MYPSSTSNSKTQPAKTVTLRSRLFSPFLLVVLFVLVACELLLRLDGVQAILPSPNRYYQPGVETRLQALSKTVLEEGPIDLLFIGSSAVRTNFRPLLFDERLATEAGVEIITFNGGFSDMTAALTPFYLEHFWLEHTSPRLILHGVRYAELTDPDQPTTYTHFQTGDFESLWLSNSPLDKVRLGALQSSQLLYYQGLLKDILFFFPAAPSSGFAIDSRGYNEPGLTLPEAKAQGNIADISEFVYQDSLDVTALAVGLAGLEQSLALAQAQGIEFVLVNIPEHGAKYLQESNGRSRYTFYIQQLQAFADKHGIAFVDITNGDPAAFQDDLYFSDYTHMSRVGAEKFTTDLAAHFTIPLCQNRMKQLK